MKILITKFRSVGDVILLTPLIRNLKSHYPDGEIDLMVNKGTEVLITHNPNINQIILHDRFKLRAMPIWQRIKSEFKAFISPIWTFFKIYIIRLGFIEGWRGFIIAKVYAQYTFWKYYK